MIEGLGVMRVWLEEATKDGWHAEPGDSKG